MGHLCSKMRRPIGENAMRAKMFAASGLLACAGLFGCNQNETAAPPVLRPQTCDCAPRALTPPPAPAATAETPLPDRYEDEESNRTVHRHHARYAMRGSYAEHGEHPWGTGYAGGEVAAYDYVSPSQHYYTDEAEGYRAADYESESAGGAYDNGGERYEDYDEGPPAYRNYPQRPMSINSSSALDSWSGYSDNGIYDHGYGGGDLAEPGVSSAAGVGAAAGTAAIAGGTMVTAGVTKAGAITTTTGTIIATAGAITTTTGMTIATAGAITTTTGTTIATAGAITTTTGTIIAAGGTARAGRPLTGAGVPPITVGEIGRASCRG